MGQVSNLCGQNLYRQLMEQYGNNLIKFLMAEKSKQIVKQKFMELMNKAEQIISDVENKIKTIINNQIQLLSSLFQKAKSSVDATLPGGIAVIQRLKGQSINNFSGYNTLISKVNNIRDQSLGKIQQKKIEVNRDLQNHKNAMINKIQQQRPKIPVYQELPSEIKRQIVKKAQNQVGDKLIENKQAIIKNLQSEFVPNSYKSLANLLTEVNPDKSLSSITGNAYNTLSNNMLSSTQGLGQFGNMINKIF